VKYKLNTEVLLYYYQGVDIYNGKIEKKMFIEKKCNITKYHYLEI